MTESGNDGVDTSIDKTPSIVERMVFSRILFSPFGILRPFLFLFLSGADGGDVAVDYQRGFLAFNTAEDSLFVGKVNRTGAGYLVSHELGISVDVLSHWCLLLKFPLGLPAEGSGVGF